MELSKRRNLLRHRFLAGIASASLAIPFIPSDAQAASICPTSPKLTGISSYTRVTTYAAGGRMGYYAMAARAAGSDYPTRVAVFDGSISNYAMLTPTAKFGSLASQKSLATSVAKFETYVNSDYFDFGSYMPESAIVSGGVLVYSPPPGLARVSATGGSKVLSYVVQTYGEATGYTISSPLVSGANKATVVGVNLKSIPANSIVAFTPKNPSATIPQGSYGIQVRDNVVTRPYVHGATVRPTTGIIFQATGSAIPYLKKFSVGNRALFTLKNGTIKKLASDTITPTGFVEFGSNKIFVNAMNYSGTHSTGATIFDRNFGPVSSQAVGNATFALDNAGVVQQVSKNNGVQITLNSSTKTRVFQVFGSQANLVSQLSVGQKVRYVSTFSSANKNKVSSASGRGSLLLSKGKNIASCTGSATSFRPRTAIGWNASGHFWVATATMGMDHNDGGYRVGGSTLRQMSDWLLQMGATEAVGFDGGGSVTQFMSQSGIAKRIDIPTDPSDGHEAWIRDVPVGIAFAPGS